MQLLLSKPIHAGQKDMIFNSEYGTYALELGVPKNISEAAGNAILEQWGAYVTRVAPQSVEAIAEAEANKMAKAYSNKKV